VDDLVLLAKNKEAMQNIMLSAVFKELEIRAKCRKINDVSF